MAEPRPRAHSPPRPKKKERPPPTPPALIRDHTRGIEFQRLGFLGEGGFARVYEARDETGRHLALKCVAKKSIQTKKAKTKLYAEIKLQQALDHPNIVGFKDVIEDEDNIYMSLELCESGSVMDILRRRKGFTEPEVRLWMVQLVGACMYMHGENVIHRDLKLGNIFLDGRLDLKIGDFGLAALIEKEGDRKKTICGTPNYIAPEVLFDTANGHSFEVDIWSIGVILYTLIIGKPPFQTKEVKAIYQRIKDNQYEFPDDKPISDEARELITGILTVDPRQRPTLQTVLDHPFFRAGPFPSSLPVSICDCAPDFQHLSPSQSAHNFARARARATQSRPVANSRVRVSLGPSVAQQEKEFQRAVQPGSPISSLISSAKQPLLVSQDSKPSLLRKLNSARAPPTDLVRRERDRVHASTMPAVGEEAAGEGEETGTNAEAEARAREELAEQKARIVAEMAGGSALAVESRGGSQRREQPPGAAPHGRPRPLARVENTSRPAGGSGVSSSRQALKPPQEVEKPMGLPANRQTGKERAALPAEARSTAHEVSMRPAGMFDAFSQNLAEALEAWDAGRLLPQHAGLPSHPPPPEVFIVSWLDYCNKYGMGYILSNGSSGVHFNDSTSIVLAPNRENFNYIASGSQRGVVSRRNYTLSACPEDLRSKVYLLKHFEGFMQERLTSQRPYCFVDEGRTRSLDFVQKYLRMKHVIVFKLSNDLLQFNFYDHVKLVLSSKGQVVSLITNDSVQTWSLAYLLSNPSAPENDPKFYSSIIKKLRYLNVLLNTIRSSSEPKAQPMQQPFLPSAQRSPLRE